jgi:hypothetical protein
MGWLLLILGLFMIAGGFTVFVIGMPVFCQTTVASGMLLAYLGAFATAGGLLKLSLFPKKVSRKIQKCVTMHSERMVK